ncbi:MAG: hypothetical protein ACR2PY_03295, partial [Salinispira sp.]
MQKFLLEFQRSLNNRPGRMGEQRGSAISPPFQQQAQCAAALLGLTVFPAIFTTVFPGVFLKCSNFI